LRHGRQHAANVRGQDWNLFHTRSLTSRLFVFYPSERLLENLGHAVSLHFLYYNFCRPHKSLKGQTPAMAASIAFHQWEIMEIVALIEAREE